MFLAALGSVRIRKNCDLGLENAALGLGQHLQDLGHSFSLYGPPSRPITYISYIEKLPFCTNSRIYLRFV